MKRKLAIMASVGLATSIVAGCNGHGDGDIAAGGNPSSGSSAPSGTTTPTSQSLDTAGVLALAKIQLDTATPFTVDSGALTLTDTSDTTTPIAVTGTGM
jgi:predicted small secreted protein